VIRLDYASERWRRWGSSCATEATLARSSPRNPPRRRCRGGNRKRGCAFYPPGATSVECECVMKDELTTILDAMRAAQAELADYLVSADRNAELTIAKLVGILDRREVVRAMRLLRALERPGRAPQSTLAEAS
jgi:hypothetical protein